HLVDHRGKVPVGKVGGRNRGAGHREVVELRSEIDEIVFDLGRPIRQEGIFYAHANGPAVAVHAELAREGGRKRRLSDIRNGLAFSPPGATALEVDEGPVDRRADPAGERRQAFDLRAAIHEECGRVAQAVAGDVAPASIRFEPEQHPSRLPVVADLAAGEGPLIGMPESHRNGASESLKSSLVEPQAAPAWPPKYKPLQFVVCNGVGAAL